MCKSYIAKTRFDFQHLVFQDSNCETMLFYPDIVNRKNRVVVYPLFYLMARTAPFYIVDKEQAF